MDYEEIKLPNGITRLENQVAGHQFDMKKSTPGMLRGSNGRIFKPGEKDILRKREIAFYEKIQSSSDTIFKELANFTPKYYGTTEIFIMGQECKFLILQDITENMVEPCVMDIKIGKRTWDPLAAPEKRERENQKYIVSKNAYGFCIPGFQVYNMTTGVVEKYNKEYGKNLNAQTVIEALKIFLNATDSRAPSRDLVLKLLTSLWKILAFMRNQTKLRFYSSSLLIAYDAQRLRQLSRVTSANGNREKTASSPLIETNIPTNPSIINPILSDIHWDHSPTTIIPSVKNYPEQNNGNSSGRDESVDKLCRTHSHVNNYERDMIEMKQDYTYLLQELTGQSKNHLDWVRVNMIDFTHVFDADDESIDKNYIEGIENLIKILESFL